MTTRKTALALIACLPLAAVGCGGGQPSVEQNLKLQGQDKAEAMKRLADAIEKKNQTDIGSAIEELTAAQIDAKADPASAREFIDVYNKQVKGKLTGDRASQVKTAVDAVEAQLK